MGKTLTEAAQAILATENANAATLKPSAGSGEKIGPGASAKIGDAPVQVNGTDGGNLGAAAAVKSKNSDKQTASAKPAEPPKKLTGAPEDQLQEEEVSEDDIEISEELAAFIDQLVAEGKSEEEITQAIEENFELVTEEEDCKDDDKEDKKDDDEDDKDDDKEDKKPPFMKEEEIKVDMTEHVDALMSGETLSEEFKTKAATILETAVKAKLQEEMAKLEEAYEAKIQEEIEAIKEELSSSVDDYLNYVVEQWTKDNEVAIEAGLRTELTEEFIGGLRELFAEHYIDIPEDKISIIEEMGAKVEELESKLNEEIERGVTLTKMLNESKSNEILIKACDGLTDTQAEKLKSLAEGIEYADVKEYEQKLSVIKESYFNKTPNTDQVLDKVESSTDGKGVIQEEVTGPMAAYTRVLGRTAK